MYCVSINRSILISYHFFPVIGYIMVSPGLEVTLQDIGTRLIIIYLKLSCRNIPLVISTISSVQHVAHSVLTSVTDLMAKKPQCCCSYNHLLLYPGLTPSSAEQ